MGLLDDAIREHLDLKRRRGADPAEVERAEREALGPVRRGPEGPEAAEEGTQEPLAYDHEEEEQGWAEPFHDEVGNGFGTHESPAESERFDEGREAFMEEAPPAYAEPEPAHYEHYEEPPPADVAEHVDEFAPPETPAPHAAPIEHEPHEPEPPAPTDHLGAETAEYQVEEAFEQEDRERDGDGEDVLEETPDFLQDTPDHDRLWFEQRPPRDFDFDN
jgi:hypothetical protein